MSLPQLFAEPIHSGRLKSPQQLPYAHLACQLEKREPTGTGIGVGDSSWYDDRKVTITIRGRKADVVRAIKEALALFNLRTKLDFPSGAKFLKLWPDGNAKMHQDEATKDGDDLWIGELAFIVRSVRQQ